MHQFFSSSETLVFSHRVSGANVVAEYFGTPAAALNTSGDVTASTHKYSRLSNLEPLRDVDGAFHFQHTYSQFMTGLSCADILNRNPGVPSGTYMITTSTGHTLSVWCDMTTDGGGYTYYACQNCVSRNYATDTNGCNTVGLQSVIPRTQAHWASMFAWVTAPVASGGLGGSVSTWFVTVPGIYKPSGGLTNCNNGGSCINGAPCGVMNSASCTQTNGWRSLDGGKWWLRSTSFTEPNGDYFANAFLSFWGWNPTNFQINDGDATFSSGNYYVCSTNDFNTGLSTPSLLSTALLVTNINEFAQTSNPIMSTNTAVAGYSPVSIQQPGGGSDRFGGLRYSCGGSLIDGNSDACFWWFSLGTFQPFKYSGFALPGPTLSSGFGTTVRWIQLYVVTGTALQCSTGTYAASTGLSACTPCSAGSFSTALGATAQSVCAACSAGTYAPSGASACTKCPLFAFCPSGGMGLPTMCAAGSYCNAVGLTQSTLCAVGMFAASNGLSACAWSLPGSFVAALGMSAAVPCAPGSYSSSQGATACDRCAAGWFCNSTTPQICRMGTFSVQGSTACTVCDQGTYASSTGQTACVKCPAGFYCNCSSSQGCGTGT